MAVPILTAFATDQLDNPVLPGPLTLITGGQIPLTELGQSSPFSIIVSATDALTILAMAPYTKLDIWQDTVGHIASGYVVNPRQQITAQDIHTVTFQLYPLTYECMWRTMHRGWVSQQFLDVVANEIASTAPNWTGIFTEQGSATDILVSVALNGDPTVWQAFLDTAKQFSQYARLGIDPISGAPVRRLEMGQMGAAPKIWLAAANGGDPEELGTNSLIRIPSTVDYLPNDVTNLANVTTPFGGGSNDSLVTLERLWRILNDPTYANFGRYGSDADSIARTGQPSLFPEYDPKYPIGDPENISPGTTLWYSVPSGQLLPVPLAAGHTIGFQTISGVITAFEYDASGVLVAGNKPVLMQGAVSTRFATRDGHWDYMMYDYDSYFGSTSNAPYGYKYGAHTDSSLTYTDPSVANQELTERALYQSTKSFFERYAHPHETFSCTVEDAQGRPTQAGDLIAVDFQRSSTTDTGTVVEMNVVKNLRVTSVVRSFAEGSPPTDTYTLSSLGRFDETDATGSASLVHQVVAMGMNKGTAIAPLPVHGSGNVDGTHPLVVPVLVPDELYRWHRCSLRVDFENFTATSTTADEPTQQFQIVVGGVNITIPVDKNTIGGVPTHYHKTRVDSALNPFQVPSTLPAVEQPAGYLWFDPASGNLKANGRSGMVFTGSDIFLPDLSPSLHDHNAYIPGQTVLANLPPHRHPLNFKVDGPTAPNCTVEIDNGTGYQLLSSGVILTSGSRNSDGTFPGSFEIQDISPFVFAPGKTVLIRVTPGVNAGDTSNPWGAGRFVVNGTWFGEWGGMSATFISN